MIYQPIIFADLMERISVDWKTECWNWKMYRTADGYGRLSYKGQLRLAHRLSLYLFGKVSWRTFNNRDKVVMHSCDNPACVNPYHLKVGTQLENIADRKAKGRCARHLNRRTKQGRFAQLTKEKQNVNHT